MNNAPPAVILFDGVCNFCNSTVNWLIAIDRKKVFHFATLQSVAAQALLQQQGWRDVPLNSFVLLLHGKVYSKSTAALKVCSLLPWYWQWTQAFWLVPPALRNAVYDLIARNRYRWFGRTRSCKIPAPEVRSRFL